MSGVIRAQVISLLPRVEFWHGFLSQGELDRVNFLGREFNRSRGFVAATNKSEVVEHRTSETTFDNQRSLEWLKRKAWVYVRQRHLPDLELDHIEPPQITRYHPGQQYKPHNDAFNIDQRKVVNDRRATVIVYLNDNFGLGQTRINRMNIECHPCAGGALYFQYDYDTETNKQLLHEGCPPVDGIKYISTIWIRQSRWPDGTQPVSPARSETPATL